MPQILTEELFASPKWITTEELMEFQPEPRPASSVLPEDRAKEIWNLGIRHKIPWDQAEELYDELQNLTRFEKPSEAPQEEFVPTRQSAGFWEKFLTAGYAGPEEAGRPANWGRLSPFQRAAFDVYMTARHYLTRVGAGMGYALGAVPSKDISELYEEELINNPRWYTKAPEAVGFLGEQALEYMAVKGIFNLTGLSKILNAAGRKLAAPFVSKELASYGPELVNKMSWRRLAQIGHDAFVGFLRETPNSVVFMTSWTAGKDVLLGKEPSEIVDETALSALWGLGFALLPNVLKGGNKAFWETEAGKRAHLAINRAYTYLWQNCPILMNMGRKAASSELYNRAVEEYRTRFGLEPDAAAQAKLKYVTRQWAKAMDKMAQQNPKTAKTWTGEEPPVSAAPPKKPPSPPETDPLAIIPESEVPIRVKKPVKDIGPLQEWILTTTNQAYNTKDPRIIQAAETMADKGMQIKNDIQASLERDFRIYKTLPKEYKGERFFELMDRHFSPEEIEKSGLPVEVKNVLRHFKEQDELMRQEIIRQKREMAKSFFSGKSKKELQKLAEEKGLSVTGKKEELAERLAEAEIPDDWGKQWGHIQHVFFGQYKLFYETYDEEAKKVIRHFIGTAETQAEAYEKLKLFYEAAKEEGRTIGIDALVATPEIQVPFDVARVGTKQFYRLQAALAEAADATKSEIQDAMRGIIGKKAAKQKWWGALLYRSGKEGYSKDFEKVWEFQTRAFYRWKHLTEMNRQIQPLIEEIKKTYPGWARHLEETKEYMWGLKRSSLARKLDEHLQNLPVIGEHVKPFVLERAAGAVKTALFWAHLQTVRFFVVNSLQPIETLWPVVGTKDFLKGIRLYYSKEGKEILRKYRVYGLTGKIHETGMGERKWERWTPAGASEVRNQALAFLALYQKGIEMGMTAEEAARYGRLRGQLFTQFTSVPSDIPKAMRGPVGGLIFQYKRFPIKSLELFARLLREKNFMGVARFLTVKLLLGGLRIFLSPITTLAGGGFLVYELYEKIKKEFGQETADVVMYGLPSLLNVDFSGSVNFWDIPKGETLEEKIGSETVGPFGSVLMKVVRVFQEDETAVPRSTEEKLYESLEQASPTARQFVYLLKALQKDTAVYDTKGRLQYREEVRDLWAKALGFRPMKESKESMVLEAMLDLKEQYDDIHDKIALDLIEMDIAGAEEKAVRWSNLYPEFPIDPALIRRRIENRMEAVELTRLERQWNILAEQLKGKFLENIMASRPEEKPEEKP